MRCCRILTGFLALVALDSCREYEYSAAAEDMCRHCISFSVSDFVCETRSILPENEIEDKITEVVVASYSVDGQLIDCTYHSGELGSVALYVDAEAPSNVYAVANAGDCTSEFPEKESEVSRIELRVLPYDEIAVSGMPMCGMMTVRPEHLPDVEMELLRLFSKVSVRILHDGLKGAEGDDIYAYNLRNESIFIRQANSRLMPFSSSGSRATSCDDALDESDYNPDMNDRNAYQGSLHPSQIGPGVGFFQDTTIVFYVPENLQGRLLPDNDDPDAKTPESLMEKYGDLPYPDICTYVEFNAYRVGNEGYGGNISYRFYLGEDSTSDFSLKRNTGYFLDLHLTEQGLFIDDWKASHGEDWYDSRCLFFLEEPYYVYVGDATDIVVHFHKYGVSEGSSAGNYKVDWLFEYDADAALDAGLEIDAGTFSMGAGENGYNDFIMTVKASEDAAPGTAVPIEIRSWDGSIVKTSSVSVLNQGDMICRWEGMPEYVSQYGILNVSGVPADRLPVSLSSDDETVLRCTRVDDDTFRVVALKEGSANLTLSNSSGSQTKVVAMDVKAPLLRITDYPDEINPDGTSCPVSCQYLTDEGKPLSGYDESVFDSVLRMSLSDRNIVLMGPQGNYFLAVTNLGDLVPGTERNLDFSVPGCPGAGHVSCKVMITDPFRDVVRSDYGVIDDYSLIKMLGSYSPVYKAFAGRIGQSSDLVFPVAPVNADESRISVAMKPEWEGRYSGANEVYAVSYKRDVSLSATGAAVTVAMQNVSASTSHGAGPHNICLYVKNAYSGQKLEHVCGIVEVYVHNVLGATAYISSRQASYAPAGGKTFAQVYNELAGRALYYQYSTADIWYMDVHVDFLASVKGVLIWNRMKEYASQRYNGYDALSFLQPDVSDGSTDSNLRHLYSVNSGAGERTVICGEDSGVRKGLGNMLYRALRLETVSSTPSESVLQEWFLGYDRASGTLRTQYAPAYIVYDVSAGETVPHTLPYHFTPSSLSECVDEDGRGYHVIHFLEDVVPSSNGWTNLLD